MWPKQKNLKQISQPEKGHTCWFVHLLRQVVCVCVCVCVFPTTHEASIGPATRDAAMGKKKKKNGTCGSYPHEIYSLIG